MSNDEIIAGILRVEAQNDRSDWHAVPKPPLGEWLHSPEYPSERECPDCGGPVVHLAQDRVYYCRRCAREIEYSEYDK